MSDRGEPDTAVSISSGNPGLGLSVAAPLSAGTQAQPSTLRPLEPQPNPLRPVDGSSGPENLLRGNLSAFADGQHTAETMTSEIGAPTKPFGGATSVLAQAPSETPENDPSDDPSETGETSATSEVPTDPVTLAGSLGERPNAARGEEHLARERTVMHFVRMLGLARITEFGPPAPSSMPWQPASPKRPDYPPTSHPGDSPTAFSGGSNSAALTAAPYLEPNTLACPDESATAHLVLEPLPERDSSADELAASQGIEGPLAGPEADSEDGSSSSGVLSTATKLHSVLIQRRDLTAPASESIEEPASRTQESGESTDGKSPENIDFDASSLSAHIRVPPRDVPSPGLPIAAESNAVPADVGLSDRLSAAPPAETDKLLPVPTEPSVPIPDTGTISANKPATIPSELPMGAAGGVSAAILSGRVSAADLPWADIDSAQRLRIELRQSRLMRTGFDISRVESTDPRVCEVIQLAPREIAIIGKQPGITRVDFWQDGTASRESYVVLVGTDAAELERTRSEFSKLYESIRELYPNSRVTFSRQNGNLIVSGTARNKEEAIAIITLVRRLYTIPVVDKLAAPR